jgi:hypothetical protein
MNPNQQNLLELAKQGNARAIAALINRSLQLKGITAKVNLKDSCLQILVESDEPQDQGPITQFLVRGIKKLNIESVDSLKIFGKQKGQDFPDWSQVISLQSGQKELEVREPVLANDSPIPEKSKNSDTASTAKQDRPKFQSTSQTAQDQSGESIFKSKSVTFSVLRSAWNWYVSGFKSRPDVPLFLSPRFYRIVFTLFAFMWITAPLGWYENTTSSDSSPVSSSSPIRDLQPGCAEAAGRIWADVRLYRDAECTQPFATVVGGGKLRSGDRGVLIEFDTGEIEWKTRDAVTTQAFVRTDDPAHSSKLWRDIDE